MKAILSNAKTIKVIFTLFVLCLAGCISSYAKTYLVAVGVGDYSKFPQKVENLNLTVNDAKAIADLYSKNGNVDYALLLNEKATRTNIKKAIKKVFDRAGENDIVVFFFSGHGYPGGFCASDGNLKYSEVRNAMAGSKSKNKMMFIDACRSGGMRVSDTDAQGAITAAKNANVMLFLSSRNNENSQEHAVMKNGFFTTYLEKGLRGNADADRNKIITAKELFNFVNQGVVKISNGEQHPVMWGSFSDDMPVMIWK